MRQYAFTYAHTESCPTPLSFPATTLLLCLCRQAPAMHVIHSLSISCIACFCSGPCSHAPCCPCLHPCSHPYPGSYPCILVVFFPHCHPCTFALWLISLPDSHCLAPPVWDMDLPPWPQVCHLCDKVVSCVLWAPFLNAEPGGLTDCLSS